MTILLTCWNHRLSPSPKCNFGFHLQRAWNHFQRFLQLFLSSVFWLQLEEFRTSLTDSRFWRSSSRWWREPGETLRSSVSELWSVRHSKKCPASSSLVLCCFGRIRSSWLWWSKSWWLEWLIRPSRQWREWKSKFPGRTVAAFSPVENKILRAGRILWCSQCQRRSRWQLLCSNHWFEMLPTGRFRYFWF